MHPFDTPCADDRPSCERARDALRAQVELLEDEWRSGGMERDTLVLLDHACARLAEVEAMLAREPEPAA